MNRNCSPISASVKAEFRQVSFVIPDWNSNRLPQLVNTTYEYSPMIKMLLGNIRLVTSFLPNLHIRIEQRAKTAITDGNQLLLRFTAP